MSPSPIDSRVIDATVRGEYPTPIAEAWGWVRAAKTLHEDVEAPILCFELLLRFLGGALLADYLSGPAAEKVEALLTALDDRQTMGDRLDLVRELCRSLPVDRSPAPFFAEAHSWLFEKGGRATPAQLRLKAMVEDRNVKAHKSGMRGSGATEAWARDFSRQLAEVLHGLRWLGRYRLFTVHSAEPGAAKKTFTGRVQIFRGSTARTEQGAWTDPHLAHRRAHFVNANGTLALDVSPFIVWQQDQGAHVERIHIWRSVLPSGAVEVVNDENHSIMEHRPRIEGEDVPFAELLSRRGEIDALRPLGAKSPGALVLPESDPSLHNETILDGRYRIEHVLGRTNTATVYAVTDLTTRQLRALKVMNEGVSLDSVLRDRFKREERVLRQVECRFVLSDVFGGSLPLPDARPYLSMPLCRGTVHDRLALGKLPRELVGRWLRQLVVALQALHQLKVVHRDIKPSNMLLDDTDNLRVADLGLALETEGTKLTRKHDGAGYTEGYAAPEAKLGQAEFASDVFSAGVVAYELLTGRIPKGNLGQGTSKEERALIEKMMRAEADERPSLDDVAIAIRGLFPGPDARRRGEAGAAGPDGELLERVAVLERELGEERGRGAALEEQADLSRHRESGLVAQLTRASEAQGDVDRALRRAELALAQAAIDGKAANIRAQNAEIEMKVLHDHLARADGRLAETEREAAASRESAAKAEARAQEAEAKVAAAAATATARQERIKELEARLHEFSTAVAGATTMPTSLSVYGFEEAPARFSTLESDFFDADGEAEGAEEGLPAVWRLVGRSDAWVPGGILLASTQHSGRFLALRVGDGDCTVEYASLSDRIRATRDNRAALPMRGEDLPTPSFLAGKSHTFAIMRDEGQRSLGAWPAGAVPAALGAKATFELLSEVVADLRVFNELNAANIVLSCQPNQVVVYPSGQIVLVGLRKGTRGRNLTSPIRDAYQAPDGGWEPAWGVAVLCCHLWGVRLDGSKATWLASWRYGKDLGLDVENRWGAVIEAALSVDPNKRPTLDELHTRLEAEVVLAAGPALWEAAPSLFPAAPRRAPKPPIQRSWPPSLK